MMGEPMEHAEFPDDETLAAFIDGALDEETRQSVVTHVADCEECYSRVLAARAWKTSGESSVVMTRPRFGRRRWAAGLAIAAAAAGVLFFTPPLRDRYALHNLEAAANTRPNRPAAELPLSGGFAYRPRAASMRGPEERQYPVRLQEAASDAAERAQANETPRNLHTLGVAYLLLGEADEALKQLAKAMGGGDQAAVARCNDVSLLVDFGAAAYANHDLALARSAYQRALVLAPDDRAAKFGLAKTLQDLGRTAEAAAAWNGYLKLDPSSGWADEARAALKPEE